MRPRHPDAEDDEVHIGNCWRTDAPAIGWRTKRLVAPCLNSDGQLFRTPGFCAVLVKRAEIEAAGIRIPNTGPVDHRW